MLKKIGEAIMSRPVRKQVQIGNGSGFTTVRNGRQHGEVEVWVDVEKIVDSIGYKAFASKKKIATACGGGIRLVAKNLRHVPEDAS